MSHADMDPDQRLADSEQAGQADMLQALRSASLPDDFWMYSYKILPCPHGYRHSWTHCPFSHVGETARRRCPRTHAYLPDPCVNARAKRQCPNGDACPYAHNTFEQWLHPARYRTRLCYLGANCRRPTCFFAHSVDELRSVEENEGATAPLQAATATGAALPLPLPLPPPLPFSPPMLSPSPSASGSGLTAGASGEVPPSALPLTAGSIHAAATSATASAPCPSAGAPHLPVVPAGAPMGLLQPVVLMGIPQPHQGLRSDMLPPPGAVQCFVPYQARPAMMHPPMPMPQAPPPPPTTSLQGDSGSAVQQKMPRIHVQMPPPPPPGSAQLAAVPVAVRPPQRPHLAGPMTTVAIAPVHHPGSIHIAPAGAVYIRGGVPPSLPAGAPGHVPMGPPQQQPQQQQQQLQGFASPFVAGGGFYPRGGEGVPQPADHSGAGRARSYSNPGETAFLMSAGPTFSGGGGGGCRTYPSGEQPPRWASAVDAGRRISATTTLPSPRTGMTSQGSRGGVGRGADAVPRHMPAPTNRGHAVRRMSTPADGSQASVAIAAAAAAAVTAMHYSAQNGSAGTSPVLRASASTPNPQQQQQQRQQQQLSIDGLDAALQALSLAKAVAAPPSTPAAPYLTGSGSAGGASHYSTSPSASSSPLSVMMPATAASGSPSASTTLNCDAAAAVAAVAAAAAATRSELSIMRVIHSSVDGAAGGSTFSRPSSSGSATSAGTMLSAYDSGTAAAVAAASMPSYHTLLQHVLSSTSSSTADLPCELLPTLLSGAVTASGTDVDAVHAELYYDDGEVEVLDERSSDPGPAGLRAAIRRISSEYGSVAACRNSDPGQSVSSAASPDVQRLLLPLLQSVLTEGLATGQFELVNGQLQVKGGGGAAVAAAAAGDCAGSSVSAVAFGSSVAEAAVGLPRDSVPCVAGVDPIVSA